MTAAPTHPLAGDPSLVNLSDTIRRCNTSLYDSLHDKEIAMCISEGVAEFIRSRVAACAGMADPATELAMMRNAARILREVYDALGQIGNDLSAPEAVAGLIDSNAYLRSRLIARDANIAAGYRTTPTMGEAGIAEDGK